MANTTKKKKTGWAKWLTWAFVAQQIAKGMLNAVGSVFIYVALILLIIHQVAGTETLRNALAVRAPALSTAGARSGTAPA